MKSPKKTQYKALMLDVDGTTIKNEENAMPSAKVKEAINKASKLIKVGIATSRPFAYAEHIIKDLNLSAPCILTGGAQIYDVQKKKTIIEHEITKEEINIIYKISKKLKIPLFIVEEGINVPLSKATYKHPIQLWAQALDENLAHEFMRKTSEIPSLSVHKIQSWTKGKLDVIVADAKSTKQHGIIEVAEFLNISTKEIIGVGDGYNDFPLLMACGLKVAMGNAVPELKEIADYIAPSVDEDGVADVIEKFVL